MKIMTDFPAVTFIDSNEPEAVRSWLDTLGNEWVRVNLVTDSLGHLVGATGSSADLTGGADRDVLTALRASADVVVLGGETVRREPEAVPRSTPLIVVSKSGDVPIGTLQKARAGVTILHGAGATVPAGATGVALSRFAGSSLLRAIRALGHRRILIEGGPTIVDKLLSAGLVDEVCITLSPRLGAANGPALPPIAGVVTAIAHDEDGFRYTRKRPDGAPQRR